MTLVAVVVGVALATRGAQPGQTVEAAPSMTPSVVAAIGTRLVVLSAADGHVERTLVSTPHGRALGGVAVSTKTRTVYYTVGGQCGARPEIWQVPASGGTPRKLVSLGAAPSVSPDGRFLAYATSYAVSNRCEFENLAVRDLKTGKEQNAQLGGFPFVVSPETWWPDSRRIEISSGPYFETVRVEADGLREVGQTRLLGNGYVFLPTGEPITAIPGTATSHIVTFDPTTGTEGRTILQLDQPLVLLGVDASGTSFLLDTLPTELSTSRDLYRARIGDPQPIKLAAHAQTAAWLPSSTPRR